MPKKERRSPYIFISLLVSTIILILCESMSFIFGFGIMLNNFLCVNLTHIYMSIEGV